MLNLAGTHYGENTRIAISIGRASQYTPRYQEYSMRLSSTIKSETENRCSIFIIRVKRPCKWSRFADATEMEMYELLT